MVQRRKAPMGLKFLPWPSDDGRQSGKGKGKGAVIPKAGNYSA